MKMLVDEARSLAKQVYWEVETASRATRAKRNKSLHEALDLLRTVDRWLASVQYELDKADNNN